MKIILVYCRPMLLFFIFLAFPARIKAQVSIKDTSITLITAMLNDGTKIWGILKKEDENKLLMYEFNVGEIQVAKKDLFREERERIETAVFIETSNRGTYYGFIVEASETSLKIKSALLDHLEIQSHTILKITPSENYVSRKDAYWFSNPNATRYLFAPSAIPLKKKEGYYQNAYLFMNSVNVGITNNLSFGGGVAIPFLFYLTPKISYAVGKNLYLGAGVLFAQSFITDLTLSAGIAYGIITVGNREHNASIGAGYGFAKFDSSYKATNLPIISVNGMTRIGRRLSLITENWLFPRTSYDEETTVVDPFGFTYTETISVKKDFYTLAASLGLRLMPNLKTSIDFSVVAIRLNPKGNYLVLPYLDFVYAF